MARSTKQSIVAVLGMLLAAAPAANAMVLCGVADTAGGLAEGRPVVLRATACRSKEVALPVLLGEAPGDVSEDVAGSRDLVAGGQVAIAAGEGIDLSTDGDLAISAGADAVIEVGKSLAQAIGRDAAVDVGRDASVIVGKRLVVKSGTEIVLQSGSSRIVLSAAGITLSGPSISLKSSGDLQLKGSKISQN